MIGSETSPSQSETDQQTKHVKIARKQSIEPMNLKIHLIQMMSTVLCSP
jgi:hypothetical protein